MLHKQCRSQGISFSEIQRSGTFLLQSSILLVLFVVIERMKTDTDFTLFSCCGLSLFNVLCQLSSKSWTEAG